MPSITLSIGLKLLFIFSLRLEKLFPRALSSKLFLASENLLIIFVRKFANGVNNALASSKSPIIICQVLDQPD